MTNHIASCPTVRHSVGRLAESLEFSTGKRAIDDAVVKAMKIKVYPRLSREERATLDKLFAVALHKSGVEYLRSDLKKESEVEVTAKIDYAIKRLHSLVKKDVVFAFTSDSCNLMAAVRRSLTQDPVTMAYGCSAHALNNLCEDIAKLPSVKETVRLGVFVSKTIKNQGLLSKIFAEMCQETLRKTYAMALYSASRWSSINFMFVRLLKVKRVVSSLFTVIRNEKRERQIDATYTLPRDFAEVIIDSSFWSGGLRGGEIFDPISKCIGILESTNATLATAYACFVAVQVHVHSTLQEPERGQIITKLRYRWNRIYTPAHALAFYCDPFYRAMRLGVHGRYGAVGVSFLELGKGDIQVQCRSAIASLRRKMPDVTQQAAMAEYMRFCTQEPQVIALWADVMTHQPRLIWGQAKVKFPVLSQLLIKVYTCPASTAGVERQHKVAKRVHTAARNRMASGKVEQQVAIAHNTAVAAFELQEQRQKFEDVLIRAVATDGEFTAAQPRIASVCENGNDDDDQPFATLTEAETGEQEDLCATFLHACTLASISDDMLFSNSRE